MIQLLTSSCDTWRMMTFDALLLLSCSVMSNSFDPIDCSTAGLSVHHHLLELAQTHVH